MRTKSKGYYRRKTVAICWFKESAGECIAQASQLASVLGRNGCPVDFVRTQNPGYVTYEDDHQVAAIPFRDR